MASKWRVASELAVVGVLAAATTLALTRTGGETQRRPDGALSAVRASPVPGPAAVVPVPFAQPAAPMTQADAAASSGRSVGRSAWRTAFHEPAVHVVDDIPLRALEAYQRAATVIDLADDDCHLDWPLLAALAKVESDHGRYAGASIDIDGRVHPPILGPRLTGSDDTARIADTDAGRLDGDLRVDRALGPFQIVPATWTQVRVDADGDLRRDPNDIDDAALAASVFLCAGRGDLSTSDGQRLAVGRYNPDGGYARLVLEVMAAYEHTADAEPMVLVRVSGGAVAAGPPAPTSTPTRPGHDATFEEPDSPSWSGATATTPTRPGHDATFEEPDSPSWSGATVTTPTPTPRPPGPPKDWESRCPRADQYGVVFATARARLRSNGSACMYSQGRPIHR